MFAKDAKAYIESQGTTSPISYRLGYYLSMDNPRNDSDIAISGSSAATLSLYQQVELTTESQSRLSVCARLILAIFDDFYAEFRRYPWLAKAAFESNDPNDSIRLSRDRLGLYSQYVSLHGPKMQQKFPQLAEELSLWDALDELYRPLIAARYEADIAFAFAQSLRRNICHEIWQPVAYSFAGDARDRGLSSAQAHQRFRFKDGIDRNILISALQLPRFKAPFRDLDGDVENVLHRLQEIENGGEIIFSGNGYVEFVEGAFFRDLTAFLVGRIALSNGSFSPMVLAMLNSEQGIYIDALLYKTADVHNLFSSTLANFHVTNNLYYQTCVFLSSFMPLRPIGLHYSTIGFNHVGKVAILNEIKEQLTRSGQRFSSSPGADGTVAIGFTFDDCSYHLKIIRDKPTREYKWGEFAGVSAVLEKYRVVHEINRTGSMVDNVMYFNLQLKRDWFEPELLDDLLQNAAGNVQVEGDHVNLRCLVVQLKIVPLPVFFETADDEQIERAIRGLGYCIKNNIAANIFNKDLDARNYGVGRYGKVFLFDYDAVERFTDILIASNLDMEEGEEDVPDWFFSKSFVFLPEELESGLQIRDRWVRRLFREIHPDLLTLDYWEDAQRKLKRGEVIGLRAYPEKRKLPGSEDGIGDQLQVS